MNAHDFEQFSQWNFNLFLGILLWMIIRVTIKVTIFMIRNLIKIAHTT